MEERTVRYEYDAQGIRVSSTVDGVETRYLVDTTRPYAQVLEEYTIDGTTHQTQVSYTYGLDLLSQDRGSDDLFYLEDGHSGVRQLTDEAGGVTDTYSYDAYGNVITSTGASENNYLYRGEQFDPNTSVSDGLNQLKPLLLVTAVATAGVTLANSSSISSAITARSIALLSRQLLSILSLTRGLA